MLHTDPGFPMVVGADVTVGHHATLHGCTIGDGTLVGMGATVMNGARIGAGCLIAANALVLEGRDIPDRSLVVGAPAKVIRQLDDAAVAEIIAAAAKYVANWRRFSAGMRRVDG